MKNVGISMMALAVTAMGARAQNVGIGTTTPQEKLSVVSNYGYGISHQASEVKWSTYLDQGGAFVGTISNHAFHLYTNNGAAQFTLLPSGNIGIGNINPPYKFSVNTDLQQAGMVQSAGGIEVGSFIGNEHGGMGTLTNHALHMLVAGGTRGTWHTNGSFVIGSSQLPTGKVDIVHQSSVSSPTLRLYDVNANNFARLQFQNSSGSKYWQIAGYINDANNNSSRLNFFNSVTGDAFSIAPNGTVAANSYAFFSPKSYYYAVPPSDFKAAIGLYEDEVVREGSPSGAFMNAGVIGLVAPLHLPHGATITNMTVYYDDNSASFNLRCSLLRRFNGNASAQLMGELLTAGNPGNTLASVGSFQNPLVNNLSYNYYLHINTDPGGLPWPSSALVIKSVTITYTLTEAH